MGKKQSGNANGGAAVEGFFLPQRFANYQKKSAKRLPFRISISLLYEGMKKFPEVEEYLRNSKKEERTAL